jgi:3'-phosphoadenosine 5'-phosphosulfate sulfotransferase (PAPS reductase)/FAD synthetase
VYSFAPTPSTPEVDPLSYDTVIVAFSGGKDSAALLLLLLLLGVPRERIELWHHRVDGGEGSRLMDWPCSTAYCARVAEAFGVPLYCSWKVGGFETEMLRHDAPTTGYFFETPEGLRFAGGKSTARGTREQFPMKHQSLSVRWCSAYTKIMVAECALRHQSRLRHRRTLVLTGERAEESKNRAGYEVFEPHRADLRDAKDEPRLIDHWRPLHGWTASEVWALIELYKLNPHPAYRLGWGRVSCMKCIFGSKNQWASVRAIDPAGFDTIAAYERRFGKTIDAERSVVELADLGEPFPDMRAADVRAAMSTTFDEPVFIDPWILPRGAHGDACGPS